MHVITSEGMRKTEEKANADGLSYYEMMDNAGTNAAEIIFRRLKRTYERICVVCGRGKNGGDGFVIAGRLKEYGCENVTVVLVQGEPTVPLCIQMKEKYLENIKVYDYEKSPAACIKAVRDSGYIIEAVFGIGFRGALTGSIASFVEEMNRADAFRIAVDVPAGLDGDGVLDNSLYFNADMTVSMFAPKPVHVRRHSACGELEIADIGIDISDGKEYMSDHFIMNKAEVRDLIRKRKADSNKGDFGKVMCLCGSRDMTGAAYFCSRAAVETGAGLVMSAFPECNYNVMTSKLSDPVFIPLECNAAGRFSAGCIPVLSEKMKIASVIAFGCGMGVDGDTSSVAEFIIKNSTVPLVIDADGINAVSVNTDILKEANCDIVMTPHPGEMARLTGRGIAEIQSDRIAAARDFALQYGVTLVLKGDNTVVASPDGRVFINTTGNAGMARGGMGDVLTGAVAGLIPQTDSVFDAACAAVYLHGLAGDSVKKSLGELKVTPERVLDAIGASFI